MNNTIADNDAPYGSGIFADGYDAKTKLINNIIVAKAGQSALFCGNFNDMNPPSLKFNNIYSPSGSAYGGICADQTGINGNISADPLFVDAVSGNYHLLYGSPAIDAGDNTAPSLTGADLDGRPRILDGNGDGVSVVDIGAFEAESRYLVSGKITSGGRSMAGVTVILSGAATITVTTNASGNYTFSGLANGLYTLTPSKTGYTFTPAKRTVTVKGANLTSQNFIGAASNAGTYSISGSVQTSGGVAISGVSVALSGAATITVTTNASGNYTFSGLANGSYTITSSKTGYTFTPVSRSVTMSGASLTGQNFAGALSGGGTYSISGSVKTSGGTVIEGATMTLSGAGSGLATSDALGSYTFTGLANGSYTVTPAMTGYAFSPLNQSVTVSGANVGAVNFTGTTAGGTYSISGTVTSGGVALPGVTMTLSGTAGRTTATDAAGRYSFAGLANGTYTITPGKTGYQFTPKSRTVVLSGANSGGQNFTGTRTK